MLFVEALEDTGGVFDAVGAVGDGDSVAIGASRRVACEYCIGQVRVFAWDGSAWVPRGLGIDGKEAEGYELEKLIMSRLSDAWLFGRSAYDMSSYGPLDELMYAKENGYLDAFILTARATEFKSERALWAKQNPVKGSEYQAWFLKTFERKPPGVR
ncbi:MAG: hypothetical protein ABGX31_02350, partial [bacterium]